MLSSRDRSKSWMMTRKLDCWRRSKPRPGH